MAYFSQVALGLPFPSFEAPIAGALGVLDIDADGDLDIVVGWVGNATLIEGEVVGPETPLIILANDGEQNFSDVTATLFPSGAPVTEQTQKAFVGDYNGDGRPDLYMPDHGPEMGSWPGGPGNLLLSSGATGFVDGADFLTGGSWPVHDLMIGDIDNDDDDDVMLLISGGPHHLHLLVSDPTTGMSVEDDRLPFVTYDLNDPANPYFFPSSICAQFLDADEDGDLDLILPTTQVSPSLLLFNDGTGHFGYGPGDLSVLPDPTSDTEQFVDTEIADFNKDGHTDMVAFGIKNLPGFPQFTAVYLGDGEGHFTITYVGGGAGLIEVADFNNDGFDDIVTYGAVRTFLLNDGTGAFVEIADITEYGTYIIRLTAVDMNEDGRTDIIGQGLGNDDILIWYGKDQAPTQTGDAAANTLLGDESNETLNGLEGNDVLFGAQGNDTLNGGAGVDVMVGGIGNDTYFVDSAGDKVTELVNAGIDVLSASRSWAVGSNIEKVVLTGTGDFNVAGNGLANTLRGNAGNNWINGSFGKDTLTGGAGRDSFIFNRTLGPNNVDVITDYDVIRDVIRIDNAVFAGIGPAGALAAGMFNTGAAATQADDRIIYDASNGRLFFDIDGVGGAAQVHFATLSTKPTGMSAGEFIII